MNYFKPSSGKTKVEVIKECIPNVYIDTVTLAKMKIFIDECNDEIGWLGTAYKVGNDIVINDVLLFKQEVHSTTTEITPEGLSEFGEEILSQEDGVDLWNSIKVWGHSHANMSVSHQDKMMNK